MLRKCINEASSAVHKQLNTVENVGRLALYSEELLQHWDFQTLDPSLRDSSLCGESETLSLLFLIGCNISCDVTCY